MHGKELAEKLAAILATRSVTYRSVAERAGCDVSTLYRIRSGAIVNPSYTVGRAIDDLHAELCAHAA
ncbi:helix-turn-helix transcriptional regulator [Chromohalobacter sp. 296-RDG]|uniref:helix-turn-helix domain-containing protein n=1 Tax=Chromohalobacter sp. 296-RDG TaxID=2994062 RepID=UPI0024686B1C|nr:helix-turn-helix transcriptional regulator [Chromohalobacter sp. 296-RDG]